jgi:hypothetical protein
LGQIRKARDDIGDILDVLSAITTQTLPFLYFCVWGIDKAYGICQNDFVEQLALENHNNTYSARHLYKSMIRSCRIPDILKRICTDNAIQIALLVTLDGELLGSTATTFISPDGTTKESIQSLGTLIADIAMDYTSLGDEYALLDDVPSTSHHAQPDAVSTQQQLQQQQRKKSHLQCLMIELEQGLVGVSACVGADCLVIVIAAPSAPLGSVKARLQATAEYVQEALSPLNETSYR